MQSNKVDQTIEERKNEPLLLPSWRSKGTLSWELGGWMSQALGEPVHPYHKEKEAYQSIAHMNSTRPPDYFLDCREIPLLVDGG